MDRAVRDVGESARGPGSAPYNASLAEAHLRLQEAPASWKLLDSLSVRIRGGRTLAVRSGMGCIVLV